MRLSRLKITEGELMPRWYGFSYWGSDYAVCHPVPLNVVVRLARKMYFWFQCRGARIRSKHKTGGGDS